MNPANICARTHAHAHRRTSQSVFNERSRRREQLSPQDMQPWWGGCGFCLKSACCFSQCCWLSLPCTLSCRPCASKVETIKWQVICLKALFSSIVHPEEIFMLKSSHDRIFCIWLLYIQHKALRGSARGNSKKPQQPAVVLLVGFICAGFLRFLPSSQYNSVMISVFHFPTAMITFAWTVIGWNQQKVSVPMQL